MPKLTEDYLKDKIEQIISPELRNFREADEDRYLIYNGQILEILLEAIRKEFKKPETILELGHRLVPINIVQKIINKLGMVYKTKPARASVDRNEEDNEFINLLEDAMNINQRMKEANRLFKLNKRCLVEPYLNNEGIPSLRTLPRHTYEVFSDSRVSPEKPDTIIKVLQDDIDPVKQKYIAWTKDEMRLFDGKGSILVDEMMAINNPSGINPYKTLPFVYINESSLSVNPLPDDDLLRMGVALPIVLSDLTLGSKYQAWSLIYTVGMEGDIPSSPNSVIHLDFGPNGEKPEIGTVKPNLDIDGVLRLVEFLLATLLSTKNLSVGSIAGKLEAKSFASGVAKMLDQAESIEDREDQQDFFVRAEKELWDKLAFNMIPYWRRNKMLSGELNRDFSQAFELGIIFPEPKILMTQKEKLELSRLKLQGEIKFSTLKRELAVLYPNMTQEEIEQLLIEIKEEAPDPVEKLNKEMENFANLSRQNGKRSQGKI
jgi:hypothetical protein